jgi:hypothetical protein
MIDSWPSETVWWPHPQGLAEALRFTNTRPSRCLETPGTNHPVALRHIPEHRRHQQHRCESQWFTQEFFSGAGLRQELLSGGGFTPLIFLGAGLRQELFREGIYARNFFGRGVYARNFFREGAYARNFFRGVQIQLRTEGRENGDLGGGSPLVKGFT